MGAAILLLLLMAIGYCTNLAMGWEWEDSYGVVHVSGKVLCQDCSKGYREWIGGDRPIKGGKVSLTCLDERGRVMHYESDVTDERGEFEMSMSITSKYNYNTVNKNMNMNMNGEKKKDYNCWARVVSSPDPTCNVLTNFAGGKSGVKLRRPSSVYPDTVKYTLPPFYFTTPMCDDPRTGY